MTFRHFLPLMHWYSEKISNFKEHQGNKTCLCITISSYEYSVPDHWGTVFIIKTVYAENYWQKTAILLGNIQTGLKRFILTTTILCNLKQKLFLIGLNNCGPVFTHLTFPCIAKTEQNSYWVRIVGYTHFMMVQI